MTFNSSDFGPAATEHFDFTPLFEDSILSILPSALFLCVLPVRLWVLGRESRKVARKARGLYGNKLIFLTLFTALQAVILVLYTVNDDVRRPVSLAAASLVVADAFGLLILSHQEHFRSVKPATILNAYLFVTFWFDAARTRTLWIQHAPKPIAAVFSAMLAVKFIILITEATEKRDILLSQYKSSSPEVTSSVYSHALFWWLNDIMSAGFRRNISQEDLFPIEETNCAIVLKRRAESLWARANKQRSHALFWSTLNANRYTFALAIFPRLCQIGFRYAQPFLLSRTVNFVSSPEESDDIGWGLTGAFFIVFLGMAISKAAYQHSCYRFVTGVRGTLITMIYSKTVDLSITALDESAAITLMSNDTEGICRGVQLHEFWAVPFELGIALWLLQRQLELSFLAPAAVAIISTAGTEWVSKYVGPAQVVWNEGIQTRVDVSASMLGSMKAVKMLGFSQRITGIVQGLRMKELRISFAFRRLLTISSLFSGCMRTVAPLITFAFFVPFSGRELTASSAFTTLTLIGMLNEPIGGLLRAIPNVHSALACFNRIQRFLVSESRQLHILPLNTNSASTTPNSNPDRNQSTESSNTFELELLQSRSQRPSEVLIDVRNASFGWSRTASPQINDVTFSITKGSFVFIIGPVGCGKSTLLKGLMSETPSLKGFVYRNSVESAYVDQDPWIQNTSIRQNITGSSAAFNEPWFQEVVEACALDYDISAMPDGYETIVGSRGISLSGGQKQRVGLARALYSKRSLIIIDDGFSGLDAETEEKVFVKYFGQQGLLRKLGITAIIATHAASRLPYADHIIALDVNGSIAEQGTFEHLLSSGGYVQGLAMKHKYEKSSSSDGISSKSPSTKSALRDLKTNFEEITREEDLKRPVGELSTYKYYFSSIGWSTCLLSLFYLVLSGVAVKAPELLLTYWTESIATHGNGVNSLYLGIYGLLTGTATIFWAIACYHFFLYLVPVSAEKLHARLLHTVMNAPLSFFTSTDTGVTTNRFSQDMSIIDEDLPFALIDLLVSAVQAAMGAILMCFVAGYFALTLPAVFLVVWVIQKYYLRTSRQVRLLDLEAKSPLYSHFIESLSGLLTIRAFDWSAAFIEQNISLLDASQKPFYLLFCIQRWLSLVLDLMATALAVILMILVVKLRHEVNAGYVGLALLNVISFSQSLAWLINQWTSLETSIGAVSRLKNFTAGTPNENLAGEDGDVSEDWPSEGRIEIRNLSASYTAGGPPVLTDVNMSIKPGEKIGICGRTGSGKSSLIMTLLRLLEMTPESAIIIDNIDITTIPRQTLRARLNAIPQDLFFLKGSIRLNASPDGIHSDAEIIQALTKVSLWPLIEARGGLDAQFELDLLSHGQRQLFSLTRALLRSSKIVILDEVSSSIDVTTDRLVQRVIREEFRDATVIAVAHRLDTILDFDRIAVVGGGKLVEFDAPGVLLGRSSAFRELYES